MLTNLCQTYQILNKSSKALLIRFSFYCSIFYRSLALPGNHRSRAAAAGAARKRKMQPKNWPIPVPARTSNCVPLCWTRAPQWRGVFPKISKLRSSYCFPLCWTRAPQGRGAQTFFDACFLYYAVGLSRSHGRVIIDDQ